MKMKLLFKAIILLNIIIFTACAATSPASDEGSGGSSGGTLGGTTGETTSEIIATDWVQDAYLKASNINASDQFGYAVAISGNTAVVGARYEDSNQTTITNTDGMASSDNLLSDTGAAYVFKKDSNGDWIQDAYLKASNSGASDYFGSSVAIDGDIIVVGAYSEDSDQNTITDTDSCSSNDNTYTSSGAAYVFKKNSQGDWIQDAYLKPSNAYVYNYFGYSLAISGSTIVAGAYGEYSNQTTIINDDNSASSNITSNLYGAAYVFKKDSQGNWYQDAYLKSSNNGASDYFGYSVATSGDIIVVGAHFEDSNQTTITNTDSFASSDNSFTDAGAAYVFKKDSSGDWIQDAYLKASNANTNDQFGYSVAISGETIVVSAPYGDSSQTFISNTDATASSDNTATDAGAAYVFRKNSTGDWYQDAYLKASNAQANDRFGYSVAISGEIIAVGAPYEDSSQATITNENGIASGDNSSTTTDSGAVYVYKKDSKGSWYQDAYVKPSNTGATDLFGSSLFISGNNIIAGAYQEDSNETSITNTDSSASTNNTVTDSGAAYIFTIK